MRLWSLHPKYLDQKGLGAAWREGLLAQKVIASPAAGYHNHSQLIRFKATARPLEAVAAYLSAVADEAHRRGYNYNAALIAPFGAPERMPVTEGQFAYEARWLQHKLLDRAPNMWQANDREGIIEPHPLFYIVPGPVAPWERCHAEI